LDEVRLIRVADRGKRGHTMHAAHWEVADLPWDRFESARLDPETLKVVKAASLVEFGGDKYAQYLCNVFSTDPEFQQAARDWAVEETRHGEALGRYAELADPSFDFHAAFARFEAGYGFDIDAKQSVRGSRSGELIARCVVETGTSSYYTAIADATEEPLLRAICRHIASDELRHYKLFYTYLKRYLAREALSRFERTRIVLDRMRESEDDELSYAWFAANAPPDAEYHRGRSASAYMARAYRYYQPAHVDRVVAMAFKVCGIRPRSIWRTIACRTAWWALNRKLRSAMKAAA
jgi:rubrerythrin